ncbi:MAG: hypothetical protein WA071_17595 [Undibacterium umbellatum]|uniref:hypothetical protein n=1 Tax=Undibacterium umbellatum TaxID=2762300 RepID=UPI003BB735A7
MTVWITACERDYAPHTEYPGGTWKSAPCNSADLRSIKIEDSMPVLDPAIVAACFSAGFVPVIGCFLVARVVGEILKLIKHG